MRADGMPADAEDVPVRHDPDAVSAAEPSRAVKVSALIITYNHEHFVGKAIEGFLMQKTDFPCELVVVDDCSTDGTRGVIRRYWEAHPERIRVILNRRNIRGWQTMIRGYQACRGQYVAYSDGDDYWTSPDKFQRQAEFLDHHRDHTVCFHSASIIWDDNSQMPTVFRPADIRPSYTLDDLLKGNFIATCSLMFRKGVFASFPAWYSMMPVGDWPLSILHAQYGRIGYIDEPMGVYRQHAGGIYSGRASWWRLKVAVETLRRLRCVVPPEHRTTASRAFSHQCCRLAHRYCDEGKPAEARRCLAELLQDVGLSHGLVARSLPNAVLRAYAPGLHSWLKRMLKRSRPPVDSNQNGNALKEIA